MVTPPFKDGQRLGALAIASDGSRVLVTSLGSGFAGVAGEALAEGGDYLLSRSAAGWGVSAINPANSSFPATEFVGASPGLERTLWFARTPSQSVRAQDLYLREPDGSMVKIGPGLPASATGGPPAGEAREFYYQGNVTPAGESDDLSHVVFRIATAAPLWPGDTTAGDGGNSSLYEYVGVGQAAPALVGVSDGETEQEGQNLPAGTVISNCETDLGSEASGDAYNAVSASGATVFFTALGHTHTGTGTGVCGSGVRAPLVSELFARVHGVTTVQISEPRPSQCGACQTSARMPAQFAGASENGLDVFFLTEQELLPEAKGMNLYEYAFNAPKGQQVLRVSTGTAEPQVQGVARVSEDGSHVYFVAKGQLTRGPREGQQGRCLAQLTTEERAEEEAAAEQEAKEEEVASGARCRPRKGADNLYVYERDEAHPEGRIAFLGTLLEEDSTDWRAEDSRPVQATPDGRFLVFRSAADITPGDEATAKQIFEYDAQSEELVRVSVGQTGYAPGMPSANVNASFIDSQSFEARTESPSGKHTDLAVSNDGASVVFFSDGALVKDAEQASNAGALSVYEYRSSVAGPGGHISTGDVSLISDGADTATANPGAEKGPRLLGIDGSGADVFVETGDQLVAGDGDAQFDVYDARVDGGFPGGVPALECEAEACLGPLGAPAQGATVGGDGGGASPLPTAAVPAPAAAPHLRSASSESAGRLRAARLARALRACRRRPVRRRNACRAAAARRFGVHRAGGPGVARARGGK